MHGFQQGKGVCTYFTGATYTGKWERNMTNGRGIFTSPDGDKYEGHFWNNLKQGDGQVCFYPSIDLLVFLLRTYKMMIN